MRKDIKKLTLASIFACLSVVLIMLGNVIELFDLTVCAFCAMLVYVSMIEIKGRFPLLIYLTTSVLSLIIMPLSTATLYYCAFFGYYPILRQKLKKAGKFLGKIVSYAIFNIAMILLFLAFKAVFALHNEPPVMYAVLLITANIFFLCFDYALDVFAFIYIKKVRPKLNLK